MHIVSVFSCVKYVNKNCMWFQNTDCVSPVQTENTEKIQREPVYGEDLYVFNLDIVHIFCSSLML